MARIPIEIEKIKRLRKGFDNSENEITEYLISVTEKGQNWNKETMAE